MVLFLFLLRMKKYLIVGLGNIGEKYDNTRHNIGFKILDALAKEHGAEFETEKLGAIANFRFKGRTFVLLKPSTFMNLSGKAVKYWMDKEKVSVEQLLIITDDLNIDFGTIRLKGKGSAGGHNGLKDIQENEFSETIQIGNDFLILKVEKIRQKTLLINKDDKLNEMIIFETNKQLNQFSKIFYDKSKINYSINEK